MRTTGITGGALLEKLLGLNLSTIYRGFLPPRLCGKIGVWCVANIQDLSSAKIEIPECGIERVATGEHQSGDVHIDACEHNIYIYLGRSQGKDIALVIGSAKPGEMMRVKSGSINRSAENSEEIFFDYLHWRPFAV